MFLLLPAAAIFVITAAGCYRPAKNPFCAAPAISPAEAGKQALDQYDANRDGVIAGRELARSPALKNSLPVVDNNQDGRLTAGEIAARVAFYQERDDGLKSFGCTVTLNGQPLAGAKVTLVPESFLGPSVKPVSGVSDADGRVALNMADAAEPGVPYGLFRVEVSRKNTAGQETISSRFNTQTQLGCEIGPDFRGNLTLPLTDP